MAMTKLADTKFHNWLKTGLAISIAKHGVEEVVAKDIEKFHEKSLKEILTPEQLVNKILCSQCKTENILPCPYRGLCVTKTGKCSFHNTTQNAFRPCPKNICDKFRDTIRKSHKFNFPSWKNTFAERWCHSPWEIAKCFMPPDGYYTANTIGDTDFNGELSVMLNFLPIANQVDERNCNEAREVSRTFRHSPDLTVNDTEVNANMDILIAFLTCTSFLATDSKVTEAVEKIKKLKADTLTVSTQDITKIIREEIENSTRKSLQDINQKKIQILQEANNVITNLQSITSQSIGDILSAKAVALGEVEHCKRKAIDDVNTETKRIKKKITDDIDKSKDDSLATIKNVTRASIAEITQQSSDLIAEWKQKEYQQLKTSLTEDLLSFYEEEHSTIPVSPLVPEEDADILQFYVPPNLEIAEWRICGKNKPTPIHSYRNIFMNNSSLCRNIYISAQAGMGKTTLAKRICMIWCHVKSGKENGDHILESEIEMMRHFDFLFFIPLRDVHGQECTIDAMISSQIINHLSLSSQYHKSFVERLFHEEKTLVVLEGLDEWSHPHNSNCCNSSPIPHRPSRPKCTVLSTTRPWKMYEARIKNSKVDKYIVMKRLVSSSREKLVHNVVFSLTGEKKDEHSIQCFLDDTKNKNIGELDSTPVILIQLVCLWIDGRTVGPSKCEIFFSIIDFMLQLGTERIESLGKQTVFTSINKNTEDSHLPSIINKYEHCRNISDLVLSIGKLAFTALFLLSKDASLSMKSSYVVSILTKNELWCCLQMGLLKRNKQIRFSENTCSYSFIHKTFQEFFAAFYLQSHADVSTVTDTVLKGCNSLGKILEMSNVFVFLSGLRPELMQTFSEKLRHVVSGDSFTQHFRRKVLFVNSERNDKQKLLKEYQNMCTDCVKELHREQVQIYLEDFFFDQEVTGTEYCNAVSKLQDINKKRVMSVTLEDLDIGLLHKCIDMFKLDKINILGRLFIISELTKDDYVAVLTGSAETLRHLSICSRSREHGRMVAKFSSFSNISLNILQKMANLESLVLECFTMSHTVLVVFINWITQRVDMKQIGLLIKCADHDKTCPGINLDLSRHSKLESLELCTLRLKDVKIDTNSLQDGHVGSLSPDGLSSILDCMTSAKKLRAIEFYDITSESSIEKFLKILKLFDYLEVIELNEVDLTRKEIELPNTMEKLKCIMLVDVSMSSAALRRLLGRVEGLRNAVRVMLWYCNITPSEEFEKVKDEIRHSDSHRVLQDWKDSEKVYMFTFKTLKVA
ncbi:uncharacterized protein LOC123526278 [Mercenaria mercenaria]|uniref:uncharacterized protein LOC123526278 n=1 Tax=Mercenaria mercenaria TaxID=6596 RepID=UPI00234F647B|nr:uncharacterized protein LOC123526278 [Mercenaria mercenaria]XP_053378877.1 uncharacterized protein LOC123526278 [Mercenaria mercenaria]